MPVAKTSARASPPVQVVPLKTRSRAWSSGTPGVDAARPSATTGIDSPVRVEHVDLDRALDQARVGGDAVALLDQQDVAGDELAASTSAACAVAEHLRVRRQVGLERLDGALGLLLLDEGEARR